MFQPLLNFVHCVYVNKMFYEIESQNNLLFLLNFNKMQILKAY